MFSILIGSVEDINKLNVIIEKLDSIVSQPEHVSDDNFTEAIDWLKNIHKLLNGVNSEPLFDHDEYTDDHLFY